MIGHSAHDRRIVDGTTMSVQMPLMIIGFALLLLGIMLVVVTYYG